MKKGLLIGLSVLLVLLILIAVFGDTAIELLNPVKNDWVEEDGTRYYLDENSDPVTGWFEQNGKRYYLDPKAEGAMRTGWVTVEGTDYYLGSDGALVIGWLELDGNRYFLNETDGSKAIGWLNLSVGPYYMNEKGIMVTGWTEIEGSTFYFAENGLMQTGWLDYEGHRYHLNADGTLATGWLEMEDTRYYLDEAGIMQTGWLELEEGTFFFNDDGSQYVGWMETEEGMRYLTADGSAPTGWLDTDNGRCYLNEDGTMYTGWLELDGQKYYLKEDGIAATGKLVIEEETYYFTSTGANIILVNPWNYLPDDYEVELVKLSDGHQIAAKMHDALMQMLEDCKAAGHKPYLYSAYRTQSHQQNLFNNMVAKCGGNRTKAAQIVAIPGTSEHQLGLAVDITDSNYQKLDYAQEKTETQKWLMAHCWDYGFILRYPNEKSTITGIIYEPWHYRYVGMELAQELKELDICLEEYLDQLTGDGTTCGGT